MKKITMQMVRQRNMTYYCMVADPRELVRVMKRSKAAEVQEDQRPWSLSKVKEIAQYVMGRMKIGQREHRVLGLIPNAPIINLIGKFEIAEDPVTHTPFVLFPETNSEFEEYANSVEVIDGQHRLLAFADDLRDPLFSDDIPYEMIFSVFYKVTDREKKELFMITNEKQTKVETNLLRLLRKALGLLGDDEKIFDLVELLNREDISPLKGRIMIGATKITKGYKEGQLSKILDKSGVYERLDEEGFLRDDQKCKLLSYYLMAWEKVYDASYQAPGMDTLTKISGIRYIIYLLPAMLDILKEQESAPSQANFEKLIRQLPEATQLDNVFENEDSSLAFRGEGATVKLAKEHGKAIRRHERETRPRFNLADGI